MRARIERVAARIAWPYRRIARAALALAGAASARDLAAIDRLGDASPARGAKAFATPSAVQGEAIRLHSRLQVPTFLWGNRGGPAAADIAAVAVSAPRDAVTAARAYLQGLGSFYALRPGHLETLPPARTQNFANGAALVRFRNRLDAPLRVRPVYFRLPDQLVPAYYVELQMHDGAQPGGVDYYAYVIAATDLAVLYRQSQTADAAFSYRAFAESGGNNLPYPAPTGRNGFPSPTGLPDGYQPPFVPPNLVTLQNLPFSRNDPWLAPGATRTSGNNVNAFANLVMPDGFGPVDPAECNVGVAPTGGDFHACTTAANSFDYTHDAALPPTANKTQVMAAVTNLFYLNNWLHDWYYDAGFDVTANVVAADPPEGWADFHAMLLLVKGSDSSLPNNANFSGTYAHGGYPDGGPDLAPDLLNTAFYHGQRRYPYSRDLAKNPLTFRHIEAGVALPAVPAPFPTGGDNAEVHNTGEVWASMLWQCYSNLLNDTPRLAFGQAQDRMKHYLVAGYKMTPANPTFIEARDALLAVIGAQSSEDHALCMQGFAARGAGVGAVAPDRYSKTNAGVVESYGGIHVDAVVLSDRPQYCDGDGILDNGETAVLTITLRNTGGTTLAATGSFSFSFRQRHNFKSDKFGDYDGGILMISTNGTDFTPIPSAALTPSYNGVLDDAPGADNPIAAYVRTNAGYPIQDTVTVNLGTAFQGTTVYIGFVSVIDEITAQGTFTDWEIDDIAFSNITNTPFDLTTADAGVCVTLTPLAGTPQSTPAGMPFATPLQVVVTNALGIPRPGLPVTFSVPAAGASATFGSSGPVLTDASGVATAPTLTANAIQGTYGVTATAGLRATTFALTNAAASAPPASAAPVPTLGSGMLISVGAALALLAGFFLGGVQPRRETISETSNGVGG